MVQNETTELGIRIKKTILLPIYTRRQFYESFKAKLQLMRILLAEDDAVSAKVIETILKKNNHDVIIVQSGREAINVLKLGEPFDVIISDIMMPGVDGIELLKFIRNSARYKNIPVILTTSANDQKTILTALKLGLSGYLVKPIMAESLLLKLNEISKKPFGSVLIVDDEELIRKLLQNVLEREGFKIETAVDGLDALKILDEKIISLIISDIKMPNMSGTELLKAVKEKYPNIPMILMTGYGLDFTKEEAMRCGADDYITKPFKNVEIVRKIRTSLLQTNKKIAKTT